MNREQTVIPITFALPFVVRSMNIYLFPEEPLTLLDTGPKTEPARQAVEKTLNDHGFRVQDLKRIIISHGHVDHFGLARELVDKSGAKVYSITPNPAMEPVCGAPGNRNEALVQYLDSLKKIDELDAKRVFPAHGPVVDNPRERIAQIHAHHLKRKEKLRNVLTPQGSTVYELGQKLFGAGKEADIFLTVSEVFAHLDLLVQEGSAKLQKKMG